MASKDIKNGEKGIVYCGVAFEGCVGRCKNGIGKLYRRLAQNPKGLAVKEAIKIQSNVFPTQPEEMLQNESDNIIEISVNESYVQNSI